MATLTGRALLDQVLESTGATVSELFQEALATRLQAAIDAGITSNLVLASILGANAQILGTVPEGEDPLDFLIDEVADAKVVIEDEPETTFTLAEALAAEELPALTVVNIENVNVEINNIAAAAAQDVDASNFEGVKNLTVVKGDVVVGGSTLNGNKVMVVTGLNVSKVDKFTTGAGTLNADLAAGAVTLKSFSISLSQIFLSNSANHLDSRSLSVSGRDNMSS